MASLPVKIHIAALPNDVAASPIEFKDTFFAGSRLRSRVSDVWMSQNPPGFGFFTFHGDLTELDELLLFCEGKAFGSCTPRLSQATRQVFTGEKTLVRKQLQAQQMLGYPLAPVPPSSLLLPSLVRAHRKRSRGKDRRDDDDSRQRRKSRDRSRSRRRCLRTKSREFSRSESRDTARSL
jgi:hypothetical protein